MTLWQKVAGPWGACDQNCDQVCPWARHTTWRALAPDRSLRGRTALGVQFRLVCLKGKLAAAHAVCGSADAKHRHVATAMSARGVLVVPLELQTDGFASNWRDDSDAL